MFDNLGTASGCDDVGLALNLRTISQYNFEQLKEKLRAFSRTIVESVEQRTRREQLHCSENLVPEVELIDAAATLPSEEDLDKEIAML